MVWESARLQLLLSTEWLGGRHPSQLLQTIRLRLGHPTRDTSFPILREQFLKCLVSSIHIDPVPTKDTILDRLSILPDRVAECSASCICAITYPNTNNAKRSRGWRVACTNLSISSRAFKLPLNSTGSHIIVRPVAPLPDVATARLLRRKTSWLIFDGGE